MCTGVVLMCFRETWSAANTVTRLMFVCVHACVCALNNEIRREEMLIGSLSSSQLKDTIALPDKTSSD